MKFLQAIVIALFLAAAWGCKRGSAPQNGAAGGSRADSGVSPGVNLLKARAGYATRLLRKDSDGEAAEKPPEGVLQLVNYRAPLGEMSAYVSPPPAEGGKHPAIIWVAGGFSNSIGPKAWRPAPADNDQSAAAFRRAGIIMMYPSLRGGNDSPGFTENFYGEVNDVLAAEDYLSKLDYVDPARIYLGGHSTGGTLAMLVAESSDKFRAVFAFGPIDDVRNYDPKELEFDPSDARESDLRSPVKWLQAIHTPTFAFEGTEKPSNISMLRNMMRVSRNQAIHFLPVRGATHFSILAPVTRLAARKILLDNGTDVNITFSEDELAGLFGK